MTVIAADIRASGLRIQKFREQSLSPKDRDIYIGEDGAVLSGARILTGFEPVAGFWSVGVEYGCL